MLVLCPPTTDLVIHNQYTTPKAKFWQFEISSKDDSPKTNELINKLVVGRYQKQIIFNNQIHDRYPLEEKVTYKSAYGLKKGTAVFMLSYIKYTYVLDTLAWFNFGLSW